MDRRSWLWRRKSAEKSPGETESSGSISSHSERFSDDQTLPNHNIQSPEISSKAAPTGEELNDNVKILTEKLSEALLNISAKEDLVQQHAKVAEEAVSGWEKAETEVLALKRQLEAVTRKTLALEDRVGHLDGALKECLRQLRQAREEQEQKIHEIVANRSYEWESTKSELENQVVELQSQLQAAKAEAVTSMNSDLCLKLEAAEKENSGLKLELLSKAEELELRIIEMDLSTQAAETASKQNLDSIKKVAKLEAECRRLKAMARKMSPSNDHRSMAASSVYVDSFTDSQSDSGERLLMVDTDASKMSGLELNHCEPSHSDSWASALIVELDQFKNEKALETNFMVTSSDINLMDDFLEMERLAALPETESGSCPDSRALLDHAHVGENPLKAELEAMINRTAELEEKLEKMETEKVELEMALAECQDQLKTSRDQLDEAEVNLVELKAYLAKASEAQSATEIELNNTNLKLEKSRAWLEEAMVNVVELQTQFSMVNEAKSMVEAELEATNIKKAVAESRLLVLEADLQTLLSRVSFLEKEIEKECAFSAETVSKYRKLEAEISRMKYETELQNAAILNGQLKMKQDMELAAASTKFAECQKTIASLGRQLKSLATLEDFLMDSEKLSEISEDELQCSNNGFESWKLQSSKFSLPKRDSEASKTVDTYSGPLNKW
ncbi:unnamed protein product [Ilex paraguariensis]|uniref:Filament-like plant protein n=1 Tax=Ilex paraguariensis TaxID=185542 RepID=A0ABC8R4S7_9AQUA